MSAPKPSPPGDAHLPKHPSPSHILEHMCGSMSLPGFKLFLRPWRDIFGSTLINNTLVLWNYHKAPEKDIIVSHCLKVSVVYQDIYIFIYYSFKSRSCSHLPRQLHHPETEVLVRSFVENKLFWKEIVIKKLFWERNCY